MLLTTLLIFFLIVIFILAKKPIEKMEESCCGTILEQYELDPEKISVIEDNGWYAVVYKGEIHKQLVDESRGDGWDNREYVEWSSYEGLAQATARELRDSLSGKRKRRVSEYELRRKD